MSPALQPILDSSCVRVQLQALERLDNEAKAQQRAFRRELTIANLCLMVTGVLSGQVLALAPMLTDAPTTEAGSIDWRAWLPRAMGVATLLLGALAVLQIYKAREGNRLQRWLGARSGTEIARSGVFMTIAEGAASGSSELALAALEVVNRDLLQNQRAWGGIEHAGTQHTELEFADAALHAEQQRVVRAGRDHRPPVEIDRC
jgi:hypothetical protein